MVRICARVPAGVSEFSALRLLLIADVLGRVAELQGAQAFIDWTFAEQHSGQEAILDRAADVLNIHPPTVRTNAPAGKADVHVTTGAGASAGLDGVSLVVATVPDDGSTGGLASMLAGPDLAGPDLAGPDPLAIRFALLSCPLQEPAGLSEGTLTSARETLGQWRSQVARWAESPSRPIPEQVMAAYRTAFGAADTAAVVTMLHTMAAEDAAAPGGEFESFLYADRVLGLDLPASIGRI
jgi:hypothetical protein